MYRIEQKQGKYYVCEYKQSGPFQKLVKFQGPFSRLRADEVLEDIVETIYLKKLEAYAHDQDRNSQR